MGYVHRHRVRYHEVDAQAFLFNARYLEIADVAMAEFFRHLGWTYPELLAIGCDPSVLKAELHFSAPARLDETIDYHVSCTHVGRSSFHLGHRVVRAGVELASISLVYVNIDPRAAVAVALPPSVSDRLSHSS